LLGLGEQPKAIQEEGAVRSLTQTKATLLLSEAEGVRERAHLLEEGPARPHEKPSIMRRDRREQAQFPLRARPAFRAMLGVALRCDPQPSASSFGIRAQSSLSQGQRSAERGLGQPRAAPTTKRTS
jgi:hypothetical protein